jgi:hypothetical protein
VIRALVVLVGLLAGVLAFAAGGAQAAGPEQALGVTLHHNRAATERLPQYLSAAPIAVHVGGHYAGRLNTLTATATGPSGEAISTPLARTGNTFSGNLHLGAPGTWTVAFSTQLGSVSAALANVPLDVVDEDAADLAARLAFALSALSIVIGLALVLRVNGRPLALAVAKRRS